MGRRTRYRPAGPEETYTVVIKRDLVTGIVVSEEWSKDGKVHFDGGPARFRRDPMTGVLMFEKWYSHGQLHREGAPAIILRRPNGSVYLTKWFEAGKEITVRRSVKRRVNPGLHQTPLLPPAPAG
jgi:hypothetical protein